VSEPGFGAPVLLTLQEPVRHAAIADAVVRLHPPLDDEIASIQFLDRTGSSKSSIAEQTGRPHAASEKQSSAKEVSGALSEASSAQPKSCTHAGRAEIEEASIPTFRHRPAGSDGRSCHPNEQRLLPHPTKWQDEEAKQGGFGSHKRLLGWISMSRVDLEAT